MQAAGELDYRPNLLARSLRTNLSQTIGFISDVVAAEPFAGHLIRSSMTTALLHEHLLFVGASGGDPEVEQQLVRSMLDRGVGGFLYASSFTRVAPLSPVLMAQRVVMLNCLPSARRPRSCRAKRPVGGSPPPRSSTRGTGTESFSSARRQTT